MRALPKRLWRRRLRRFQRYAVGGLVWLGGPRGMLWWMCGERISRRDRRRRQALLRSRVGWQILRALEKVHREVGEVLRARLPPKPRRGLRTRDCRTARLRLRGLSRRGVVGLLRVRVVTMRRLVDRSRHRVAAVVGVVAGLREGARAAKTLGVVVLRRAVMPMGPEVPVGSEVSVEPAGLVRLAGLLGPTGLVRLTGVMGLPGVTRLVGLAGVTGLM
ncbi:hypothetical protein GCM10009745_77960 [Kribbella yunnanensis]|uniref:Uncharacterized protein n=1 Tax=Kribbella yunnanensis TaxID=190194 RepID=A0ABP4V6L7_9ACTN